MRIQRLFVVTYKELFGFIWRFMRQQKGVFFWIFFLDAFAWPIDALVWPYILRLVIDVFTQYEGDRLAAWEALKWPVLGAIGLVLYIETASRTMGFLMAQGMPKLSADIRMAMFDHVQRHSPRYFNERFAGTLANKITDMTTQVEQILSELFWPVVPALSMCVLSAVFLWFVNPLFTWMLLLWVLIHLGICLLFTRKCDFYEHRHGEARSTLLGRIVDSFTNNFAVNLFYRFRYEKKHILHFQKEEQATSCFSKRYVEKMRCVLGLSFFVICILTINGFLIYLWMHSGITTGEVVQVFNSIWNMSVILWTVGMSFPTLFQCFGVAKQAYSLMQDPEDIADVPGAAALKVDEGRIVFEGVFFQYGEKVLFENTHVQIRGGEKVGLVGYTGAGKSTFINLILRFFPVKSGKIMIDGQDVSLVTLESLRQQIALIPQDPVLFHRTLWENIAYGKPEAADEDVLKAAKLAHCDEFIRAFSEGYLAKVGERGTKLSGGEKQRIAIARAILVNAPILILDEATSSLDSVTEKYIQDSLEMLMQDRTTLVIAHRLSTLLSMDRILVFDQGKIVEEGSHASLLASDGLYAKMWKMQVGGFLPQA